MEGFGGKIEFGGEVDKSGSQKSEVDKLKCRKSESQKSGSLVLEGCMVACR